MSYFWDPISTVWQRLPWDMSSSLPSYNCFEGLVHRLGQGHLFNRWIEYQTAMLFYFVFEHLAFSPFVFEKTPYAKEMKSR